MRVTLINYTFLPTLEGALPTLISTLKMEGHDLRLIDFSFMRPEEAHRNALRQLERETPDVIGISAGYDSQRCPSLISEIRQKLGDIPIIIGGFRPSYLLEDFKGEQQTYSQGTVWIFSGPAEGIILDFLKALERGTPPDKRLLKGIRPSLDSLQTPDFTLFDMRKYFKVYNGELPLCTSRGCTFSCTYCGNARGRYETKSPDKVIKELTIQEERHRKDGMRVVYFFDEVFGLKMRHFRELMHLLKEERIPERLPWFCQTRPEVVSREWAREAASGGCRIVQMALECADESFRNNVLGKRFSNRQFRQAVRNLREEGMEVETNIMTGMPGTSFWTDLRSVLETMICGSIRTSMFLYWPDPKRLLGAHPSSESPLSYRMRWLSNMALKALAMPYFIAKGMYSHGIAYPTAMGRYLLNIRGARPLPLWHRLTIHNIHHRPVHNLALTRVLDER